MTATHSLDLLLSDLTASRKLRPQDVREVDWRFWELRTFGLHRVVGLVEKHVAVPEARELHSEIRSTVSRHFPRSWWRGMAYGVVIDVPALRLTPEEVEAMIDVRDNRKGTLQWVIVVARSSSAALGIHTWIEGYLSPVYRGVLQYLRAEGFDLATATKKKGVLMTVLTAATDLQSAVSTFNLKQGVFPEFRERD